MIGCRRQTSHGQDTGIDSNSRWLCAGDRVRAARGLADIVRLCDRRITCSRPVTRRGVSNRLRGFTGRLRFFRCWFAAAQPGAMAGPRVCASGPRILGQDCLYRATLKDNRAGRHLEGACAHFRLRSKAHEESADIAFCGDQRMRRVCAGFQGIRYLRQ
jgi:hypothetical protein